MKRQRLFPKKVYRQIQSSTVHNPGKDRAINGFGYTIVPNDLDREDYMRLVYQTGRILMITSDNEVWKDVLVPNHLIDDLTFPKEPGEYGDLVSWTSATQFNQVQVTGKFNKPGQFHPYLENVSAKRYPSPHSVVRVVDGNVPSYIVSVEGEKGSIELKSKSSENTSSVKVNADGTIRLTADEKLQAVVEKEAKITVGEIDQLILNEKGVVLGGGESPVILGDKFVELMKDLLTEIAALTVTTIAPGSPTTVPNNAAKIQAISERLQELLSETTFTK